MTSHQSLWIRPSKNWLIGCVAALALAGCGTKTINPVTGQQERSVMSAADEVREGAKAHAQVLQEYGVLKNDRTDRKFNLMRSSMARV